MPIKLSLKTRINIQKIENEILFQLGKQHQYEYGQFLRKRYAKLLRDDTYSSEKIYIRSTVTRINRDSFAIQ